MLREIARTALISCWTESGHESSLMWEAYAGAEGVAVRTTFQHLQESIHSVGKLPVTFGRSSMLTTAERKCPGSVGRHYSISGWNTSARARCAQFCPGRNGTYSLIRIFGSLFSSIRTLPNSEAGTYL